MSATRQIWALIRRYCITLYRSPITSIFRILLWPGLFLGIVTYISTRGEETNILGSFKIVMLLPFISWIITALHVYHFSLWLVTDKSNGLKSLMMSMGLRRSSYYLANAACLVSTFMPVMIILAILVVNYMMKDSGASFISIVLVFVLFVLHINGFILVLASFITSSTLAGVIVPLLLLLENLFHSLIKLMMQKSSDHIKPIVLFFGSLSPYESLRIFTESYQVCKNCDETKLSEDLVSQPIYLILIAMTFWSILAHAFALWFDEVCPWQTDTAVKSPFYCCQPDPAHYEPVENGDDPTHGSKYFEKCLANREVGIRITGLTKEFSGIPVVSDVTFNIYKGETTLLLGHNGAGKTTLMNVILGKLTPERGKVITKYSDLGNAVGVCPQTSILDENLNVKQHLDLFADIKSFGVSSSEQEIHIRKTIDDVSLTSHMYKLPQELSGGMKRKLSLAMAFVGKSSILILDEPSSGLDPDSRVFIWNAIRRYRAERTVLLSTQHMEEADYLGDRVAIMSGGKIVCCGSSSFLTKIFGTGYKLRIASHASRKKHILEFVRKYFDSAKLFESEHISDREFKKDTLQDMVIELNDDKSKDLEMSLIRMLEEIETNSSALHIRSHGLRSSSIEDVMLNTSKFFSAEPSESVKLTLTSKSGHIETLANPLRTTSSANQAYFFYALMIKHFHVYKRDWMYRIFYWLIIPILTIWWIVYNLSNNLILPPYRANILTCFMVLPFVYYPTLERASKFKTMQLTSHAKFAVYWLSQFIADSLTIFMLMIGINIFLATTFHGEFVTSRTAVHLLSTIAIFLFGLSGALFAYLLSTILSNADRASGYFVLIFSTSMIFNTTILFVGLALSKNLNWLQKIFDYIFIAILPTDSFQYFLYGLNSKCYIKPALLSDCQEIGGFSPVSLALIALGGQIIVYSMVLYIIERINLDPSLYFNFRNCLPGRGRFVPGEAREVDKDVIDESTKAMRMITNVPRESYSLVAADLNKSYIRGVKVIDHLSFTVNRGECFGLLGVNGAGKSTTFSMIAAESKPDSGRIWLNGYYSSNNVDKYRQNLGYDPQTNPEMSLSPVEALYLMARLRLVNEHSIPMLVNSVLELLEMNDHASKIAKNLSGGTKRKLALGMSLIGTPSMLALDEPTAGVDPVARRSIWQLLRSLRMQNGASIIISSHAMEECEAICDRISIMARGRLRCLGTFLHLRSKFSQGCSIRIQFSVSSTSENNSVRDVISELSQRLTSEIGPTVKLTDTNVNSATFNVSDDSVKRSSLFKILREFKQRYTNISYMINDSSLEDIFIALAREQQQIDLQTPN